MSRRNPTKLGLKKVRSGVSAGWKSTTTVAEYEAKYGVLLADPDDRPQVRGKSDIVTMLIKAIADEPQECVVIITLDGNHKPIEIYRITEGLVNQSQIHPREIFASAIEDRAVAIVFAHNHPGGSTTPSEQDRQATKRLQEAGLIIGIPVLDSLVVTKYGATSILRG